MTRHTTSSSDRRPASSGPRTRRSTSRPTCRRWPVGISPSWAASSQRRGTPTLSPRTPSLVADPMAWPDVDELAQVLDIENVDEWQTTLDRVLASAIHQVKKDVGLWDEYLDEPDDQLGQAALRMGELISARPTTPVTELRADPTYQVLLSGHRRVFGIA